MVSSQSNKSRGADTHMRLDAVDLVAAAPRKSLALAGVAAICASLVLPALRGPGASAVGPPPRDALRRPVLTEVEERLKLVRRSSAGVPCLEFLRASYAIISIFDALPGMGMVKSDMLGNCDKIWRHQTAEPRTLQQMCVAEIEALGGDADQARKRDGSVCNSLLWLKRALRLIDGILKGLVRDATASMRDCCTSAYASSLKKYHNVVMRSAFGVAVNAAPSRAEFMRKLAPASTEAASLKTIGRLLASFSTLLDAIEGFLKEKRIES